MWKRTIHIGLSPNLTFNDVLTSLKLLVSPWRWFDQKPVEKVEQWFANYFNVESAVSFNSGRSALLAILKSLELPPESEVLIQAFTCVAVPNSILWAGLTPIYVDVDSSLNIDVSDASPKITSKTKALIVQHTFGVAADMEKVVAFCKKHKLILIEDCAHALGAIIHGKLAGTFGDAAFFSFGRDKIISSVFGGMVIVNQVSSIKYQELREYQEKLSQPSFFWILQQLFHPIITYVVLHLYDIGIGKIQLFIAQKLHLLSFPVDSKEKKGERPQEYPQKYPGALATLLMRQLNNFQALLRKRQEIAKMYFEKLEKNDFKLPPKKSGAAYLRFNILTSRADMLRFRAKQKGMILGNWYTNTIDPKGVDFTKIGYVAGSCPRAEKYAKESLNLPTYPELLEKDIEKIASSLRSSQ